MRTTRLLTAGLSLIALGGCQSMAVMAIKSFDSKPYALPVEARTLAEAPAPAAVEAPAAPAPAITPIRTNIVGQGDGSATDARIVVPGRAKDIPHKQPEFSREQVAAMVCSARLNGGKEGRIKSALRAYDATVAAYDAKLAFDAGKIPLKDFDKAELKRQDAVKSVIGNGLIFGLVSATSKKEDLPKPEQNGVKLGNIDLFTFTEAGKPVMAVSGMIHNTSDKRADLSPLTLQAIDQWGFILAGQTSLLPFESLEPGESREFEMRFHNPPDTAYEVYAHFAPPFEYRARRECDPSNPAATPTALAPHSAAESAALTAPIHSAAELNQLTRVYRNEAQSAWNLRMCGNPDEVAEAKAKQDAKTSKPKAGDMKVEATGGGERRGGGSISLNFDMKADIDAMCAAWARRAPWRQTFAMAETTDEAWGAMLAAEDARRRNAPAAEIASADAASQAAYTAFREAGAKLLTRGTTKPEGVTVTATESTFGYEPMSKAFDGADISTVGKYVDVKGEIRNTSSSPQAITGVMIALVDRLEQPLLTYRVGLEAIIAPGETRPFAQRVFFEEPVRRKSDKDTPPWQVRLGALR